MATRNRPRSSRHALGQQQAEVRRSAPGKRFIGDTAEQSRGDRRAQLERVERMAELDAAERRAEALGEPIAAILAELIQNSLGLVRTLATAPFRIALAVLRPPREA
jgi:hypothetical protein